MSDNKTWSGATLTTMVDSSTPPAAMAEGFALSMAGTLVAGDSFKIEPTRTGASSISVAITDARNIAAAAPIRAAASTSNTGTGSISAGTVNTPAPPNANLQQPVTIKFVDATHFSVTGVGIPAADSAPPYVSYTAGSDIPYNGWTIQISGAPKAGDTFTVSANTNGVSDNRNAVALGALQAGHTMAGGSASYGDAYAQLVSDVGNKTREVKALGASQQSLADSAVATQQGMSGVNLDEEAANLLRYQQAYQAAAKMIDIASKVFDSILALG
jgi:flagellar hook-associated protein 1 FlgK